MHITEISSSYNVRKLQEDDINAIYSLCKEHHLYYACCPPFVTVESILEDMHALPSGKELKDKYYVGYFENEQLVAILDLIDQYPSEKVAYIGFFMINKNNEGNGIGTKIIEQLCHYLKNNGYEKICLGWMKENKQAEGFWKKNRFFETGERTNIHGTVITAERML